MTEQHPTDYLFQQHAEQKSTRPPTDQQHPITPPQELLEQWRKKAPSYCFKTGLTREEWIATQAAQWGADQELDACVDWLAFRKDKEKLRADRRPKPPISKEQVLNDFDLLMSELDRAGFYNNCADRIRRALKSIPFPNNENPL